MLNTIKRWHRHHDAPVPSSWPALIQSDHMAFDPSVHTAAELTSETDPARVQRPQHPA